MEITNFLTKEMLMTFTMTLVIVELWVSFTKELPLIKRIPTKVYTLILAVLHLAIINTSTAAFSLDVLGLYLLLCNALIISVVLCGGYDVVTKKITINGQEK